MLTRAELERLVADLVERTRRALPTGAQGRRHLTRTTIDEVVLVGGMTRMPRPAKVEEIFGSAPTKGVNPDEVVAIGAAIQGGVLDGRGRATCCCSTSRRSPWASRRAAGCSTEIIERNTTDPHPQERDLLDHRGQPDLVQIHVLQGEREMAADNKTLGRFELVGHSAGAARRPADRGHLRHRRQRHRQRLRARTWAPAQSQEDPRHALQRV